MPPVAKHHQITRCGLVGRRRDCATPTNTPDMSITLKGHANNAASTETIRLLRGGWDGQFQSSAKSCGFGQ